MPKSTSCLDPKSLSRIVKLQMKLHESDGVVQKQYINDEMGFELDDNDSPLFDEWYGNSAPVRQYFDSLRSQHTVVSRSGDVVDMESADNDTLYHELDNPEHVALYKSEMLKAIDTITKSGGMKKTELIPVMRSVLRNAKIQMNNPSKSTDIYDFTKKVLSFVNALNIGKLAEDTVLYSGFKFNPADGTGLKAGDTFETKYPLCTTVNPLIAIDFAFGRDVHIEDEDITNTDTTEMFSDILTNATKRSLASKVDKMLPIKEPVRHLSWVLCFKMKAGQSALCSDATEYGADWLKEMEYTLPVNKKYKVIHVDEHNHTIELEEVQA